MYVSAILKEKTLLYKIQAKHVDFLICDQSMHIKAVLELDDNSHNQKDRQVRDNFVDEILTSVGYKVIRTNSITETTLNVLISNPPETPEENNTCPAMDSKNPE